MIEFTATRRLTRTSRVLAQALSLIFFAGIILDLLGLRPLLEQQRTLVIQQANVDRRVASMSMPKAASFSAEQIKWMQTTISTLNTPWDDVFDVLESRSTASTALLAVTPEITSRNGPSRLKMIAEAKDLDDAFAYLELLRGAPLFSSVQLSKQEIMDREPNQPLKITFDVNLAPRS